MLKPCLSLIVLVGSTTCSPVNFLGVPGYSQEVISPNIYPLRTALDVLQPSIGYGYGYGYPWVLNRFGLASSTFQPKFLGGFVSIPRVVTPVVDTAAVTDIVEGSAEEAAVPVVTIQHTIEALPMLPQSHISNSKFRNPIPPPIPAGIVQATQPTFVQVPIRL